MPKESITTKQYIDALMETLNKRLDSIEEKIDNFIACADEKYADKAIEKFVYAFFGAFLLSLVGIIGYLLDKFMFR